MVTISRQSTSINLTWSQPPENVVDNYNIFYTARRCEILYLRVYRTVNSSSREYNLTGLAENSDILMEIRALNRAGSNNSSGIMARTLTAGILNVTTL